MAGDREKPRSSEDRVRDAWKRIGSEAPKAAGSGELDSHSHGTDDSDVAEYVRSRDGTLDAAGEKEGATGDHKTASRAGPSEGTEPVQYDVASPPVGKPIPETMPPEVESTAKGASPFRRFGWVLAIAFLVFARCGFAADFLGEPAGEQAIDSLRIEMTAAGVSEETWSCIESGLRNGGYVDILNEASVSDVNEALESPLASPPPELISFLDGFEMYANPARSTSCLTEAEASALAFAGMAAGGGNATGLMTESPSGGLPEGVAGFAVGNVTLDADVVGAVVMTPGATLDCDGHSIRGDPSRVGVAMADNSTVRNCSVSGFNTGIGLSGTTGAVVENVEVTDSRIGFYLVSGTNNATITASNATGNEIGVLFETAVSSVVIEGNTANRNWRSGFMMDHTDDSFLIANTVTGGGSGFWITNSNRNQFVGNSVSGASEWFSIGVFESSSDNRFESNEVSGGGVAVAVNSRAANNEFVENYLHHNSKGAHVEASSGGRNTFDGNRVVANSHVGLWDDTASPASRYTSNTCSLNSDADSVPEDLC
jgi:parallel beta-helix repeat protein